MPDHVRFRDAALLFNPLAGHLRWRWQRELDRAVELLGAYGIACTRIPTTGPGSATELARQQVAAGRDLIIACGGDGTVNEVANGLAGTSVPMAVLPAGTGNALATALGLPWSIWRAAEYIPRGEVRRVALGRAGSRYFVTLAGAGADGHLMHRLAQLGQPTFKFLRYALEAYRQLWLYDFPWFEVQVGEAVYPATQVFLGRLCYFALPITPHADLFTEDFEVAVSSGRSRLWHFFLYFAVLARTADLYPGMQFLRARRVRGVPRESRVFVQTDGEVAGELPMEFVVVPEALSLLVPAGSGG